MLTIPDGAKTAVCGWWCTYCEQLHYSGPYPCAKSPKCERVLVSTRSDIQEEMKALRKAEAKKPKTAVVPAKFELPPSTKFMSLLLGEGLKTVVHD